MLSHNYQTFFSVFLLSDNFDPLTRLLSIEAMLFQISFDEKLEQNAFDMDKF